MNRLPRYYRMVTFFILFALTLQSSLLANGWLNIGEPAISRQLRSWQNFSDDRSFAYRPSGLDDALRLTQRITIRSADGSWAERNPDALYIGERFYANVFDLENIRVIKSSDRNSFIISQLRFDQETARHEFFLEPQDGLIEDIEMDREFLKVMTSTGRVFSLSMVFARTGLFNHRLPLVFNLDLAQNVSSEQKPRLFTVSRARKPPRFSAISADFFTTLENRNLIHGESALADAFRLEAGDQLLISDQGILLGHFNIELLRAHHLFATHILLLRARFGFEYRAESNRAAPQTAAAYTRWAHDTPVLQTVISTLEAQIHSPPKRDVFLMSEWAPTYSRIAAKGSEVLAALEASAPRTKFESWTRSFSEPKEKRNNLEPRIENLRAGLAAHDLRGFWRYILEKPEQNRNLINWALEGKRPQAIAATAALTASTTALITANSSYHDWGPELTRSISDYLTAFIPDVILMNPPNWNYHLPYSAYLIPATFFLLMMSVPLLQTIGGTVAHSMGGRHKGIDFKLGLGLLSLKGFSYLTPAWYLHLPKLSRRLHPFFEPLAEGFSPFRTITAESPIGQRLRLSQDIQLGTLNEPTLSTSSRQIALSLRRQAIGELILNKERGRVLALVMGIAELAQERSQTASSLFEAIQSQAPGFEEIDTQLKRKIGDLWARIEELSETDFYFPSLFEMTETDFETLHQTISKTVGTFRAGRWFMQNAMTKIASWGLKPVEFLRSNRITQSIADQSWLTARTDLVFGIYLTALAGGRANYQEPTQLAADPEKLRFLYASGPNTSDSMEQTGIQSISVPAREFILWFQSSVLTEITYAPIDQLEIPISHQQLGTPEQIKRGLSELFSRDGAELLASKMWSASVPQRIELFFASMIMSVAPRILLADAGFGDAFVGSLQGLLTSVGFGIFWWIVSILNYGAEGQTAENEAQLTDALVALKRAIDIGSDEQKGIALQNLKLLYSIVPAKYQENFQLALHLIEPASSMSRVDLQLRAEQDAHLLMNVWTEIEALKKMGYSTTAIQTAFQKSEIPAVFDHLSQHLAKLRAAIEQSQLPKGITGEPAEVLSYAQKNTPFHTRGNWVVPEMNVWIIGSVGSNIVGSYIIADSYLEVSALKLFTTLAIYFPALWAAREFLQNGITRLATTYERQTFIRDSVHYGPEEAQRRAAMREAKVVSKKLNTVALLNPLHRCQNHLGKLGKS